MSDPSAPPVQLPLELLKDTLARARAVADRLIELGVPPSMIEIRSYGEERPQVVGPEDGPERENRRVDIRIEGGG